MIREEERVSADDDTEDSKYGAPEDFAKLLESSHAWLGASTSSIAGWSRSGGQYSADSYQYQLQSMWQKCWNTNQSLVHNLRFRERGPLKSWRPETMAEAIFSVLREGLSLSQAARKYDIPYPTFVLYANRVHNMLGPSTDGGADLRPKGRGRPQRILLGSWPEEHIHGVIRAVVFRDTQHIKDDSHLAYPRLASHTQARRSPLPTNLVSRYVSSPLAVGGFSQHIKEDPDLTYSHLAQMQETLQGYGTGTESGPSCTNGPETTMSPGVAAAAAVAVMAQGLRQQMCSVGATDATVAGLAGSLGLCLPPPHTHSHPATSNGGASPAVSGSPSPPAVPSPLASVGLGGGMPYKPPPSFASPRPETLFQEDIEEIVKSPNVGSSPQNLVKETKETTPVPVKLESSVEAQDE
ncbi:protein bric-a-brac 1-like [Schistocerca americana]|nr:protein bric-a-brac 1-like [Schistocerca americana]